MGEVELREFFVRQAQLDMNPSVTFGLGGSGFMRPPPRPNCSRLAARTRCACKALTELAAHAKPACDAAACGVGGEDLMRERFAQKQNHRAVAWRERC